MSQRGKHMEKILCAFPSKRLMALDALVANKQFANRNEAIREAVREFTEESDNWRQIHLVRALLKDWNEGKSSSDQHTLLTLCKVVFPKTQILVADKMEGKE